jgi:hypothetical protein
VLHRHRNQILIRSYPMMSMKETGQGMSFVYLDINIIVIDWRNLSFLNEARMAAALTDKQIGNSRLPIVSMVPVVGEL